MKWKMYIHVSGEFHVFFYQLYSSTFFSSFALKTSRRPIQSKNERMNETNNCKLLHSHAHRVMGQDTQHSNVKRYSNERDNPTISKKPQSSACYTHTLSADNHHLVFGIHLIVTISLSLSLSLPYWPIGRINHTINHHTMNNDLQHANYLISSLVSIGFAHCTKICISDWRCFFSHPILS